MIKEIVLGITGPGMRLAQAVMHRTCTYEVLGLILDEDSVYFNMSYYARYIGVYEFCLKQFYIDSVCTEICLRMYLFRHL